MHLQPHPLAPGAEAVAEGNCVYLDLRGDSIGSERSLHLLRHELCHVLQQRRGLALAERGAMLEAEAELCATDESAANAMLAELAATQPVLGQAPVLQRFTRIGDQSVIAAHELSPKAQIILEMIPMGDQWLRRMGSAAQQYSFESEPEFLVQILQGIHATPTLLLPALRLMVSPRVLYQMHYPELERIRAVEQHPNEKNFDLHIRTTLIRQRIWSEAELNIGDEFLEYTGVSKSPVFSSRSLEERIAIFELVNEASTTTTLNPELQKEAAEFAVSQAQSTMEFVDYYAFYMAQIKDPQNFPRQRGQRLRAAEALCYSLTSLLFEYLWCPQFEPPPRGDELPAQLAIWCSQGYRLGFPRISAALSNVAQYAGLEGATGKAARELIRRYMDRIQATWIERAPNAVRFSQSGIYREYVYRVPGVMATLQLSPAGNLTIGSYTQEMRFLAGSNEAATPLS